MLSVEYSYSMYLKLKQFACAVIVLLTGYYFVSSGRSQIEVSNETGCTITDIYYVKGCLTYQPSIHSLAPGETGHFDPHGFRDDCAVGYTDQKRRSHWVRLKDPTENFQLPQQITVKFLPNDKSSWSSSRLVGNHLLCDVMAQHVR